MKKIFSIIIALIVSGIMLNACKKDTNPSEGDVNPFTAMFAVKSVFKGADVKLTPELLAGASFTGGVVVSNQDGKNVPKGALVIQNSSRGLTRGILIDMGNEALPFVPGDSVVVNIIGAVLGKNGSSLQLRGIPLANIQKISSNNKITSKTVALGELNANFANYENTLVKVTADTKPLPATGDTYLGSKTIDDGSGTSMILYTQEGATFSGNSMPASATYSGIALNGSETGGYGDVKQIRIRTSADVENASGPIYPNWPESFESPDATFKGSYNMNTAAVPNNNIDLKTGNWKLEQAIIGNLNANRDRFNAPGLQCIRMQQNLTVPAYLQMNFDLNNGVSKVTFWHGAYSTDAVSTFRLEYSTNSGVSWVAASSDIKTMSAGSKQETFLFDIKGKVRFRFVKLGLGTTSVPNVLNGRLCIEDVAVFSN